MVSINFNPRNFVKVVNGSSRTTLRLGDKAFAIGHCAVMCDGQPTHTEAEIIEVRKVRFGSLGLTDAVEYGYWSVGALKAELESCYECSVKATDVITIVRFELAGDL